ncbi:MAG: response regulator [Fuerstiella sp.]
MAAARHGQEALTLIAQKKPDVVLLDVEMPVMDDIDTLKQIRRTDRKLPVLMFSSLTVAGAEANRRICAHRARQSKRPLLVKLARDLPWLGTKPAAWPVTTSHRLHAMARGIVRSERSIRLCHSSAAQTRRPRTAIK